MVPLLALATERCDRSKWKGSCWNRRGPRPEGEARREPHVIRTRTRSMGIRKPCLDWATEPAPRSFWRGSGASMIAKVAYPTLIVGLWLAFLWLVGALSRLV